MNKKLRFGVVSCVLGLAGMLGSCGGDDGVHHLADAPGAPDTPGAVSMLAIDRATASYGSITVGTTSPPTTFTITNTGGAVSGVLAPALSGADAGSFAIGANTCTAMLPPAATCTVEVTFAPMSSGTKSATFAVAATPGGMVTAALDGQGVGIGALTLTSTQSSLGSVVVGQTGTIVSTFTATNTGTGTTGALSVIPAGSDAADFAKTMDMCSGVTLAPAASCTFQVRHAPQTTGAKAAFYQVIGTPGGNVSGAVTGMALAPASLRSVPLQLELGSVAVGGASPAITVTIANLGDETTGTLSQTVTGAGFSATGGTCTGATLAGHTTCTVSIELRPTTTGAKTGLLTITGAPGGTVVTTLVGDGVAASGLAITPSAKQFSTTNVGSVSAAQQFTITNNGAATTGALTATLGGSAADQFTIVAGSDTCTGNALAAAATCTVSIVFGPSAIGLAHGTLTIAGSPGGSVTAGLLGVGAGPPVLSISPPSRGFGSVASGAMSPPLTFTITNLGGQVSGVPAATLTGGDAAQFAIAGNTCTAALAPGAECTVQVRFAPTSTGAKSASLSVTATPGGTVTSALTGDGAAVGGLVILPSNTTLPVTAVGDTSSAGSLTVLNTGTATTSAISVSSSVVAEFSTTTTCTTLAPGATCTIGVTFAPSASGGRSATITAAATTGGTATASVAGQGIPRLEIIALESGPVVDPADFGSSIVNNSTPNDMHILVRNNTATAKTFGVTPAFGSPAQYAVVSNTCSTTIGGAGGLCTVTVRFAPTTAGMKTGSIAFDIGAGATNRAVQNLTGNGVQALQITALDGTDFGSIPVNTTAPSPLRFRVTNPAGSQTSGTIAIALAGGAAFSLGTDGCTGQTLVASASCIVQVTFAPTAVASAMTTLTATASPGGMPFIDITGRGVAPTGSAPTNITLAPSAIAEDAPSGSTVGTLSTTDADAGDTFTYALVGGAGATDNAAFTLSGAMVRTAGVLDFEIKSSYSIRVRVTDSGGNIFEKALTITVTNVDELPVAVNDTKTVAEDALASAIDVLANDTDPDGGPKMIVSVTQPAHGTVVITGGGTGLTYQPAANYAGADSFTYTLNGGSLGTVAVTVTPVDDPPVAVADSFMVNEDSPAGALAVLANDTDIDAGPMSITAVTQPAHGVVVITGGGTGLTFAPTANYNGPDQFTYTLNGGSTATVSLTIVGTDDPPVAVDDAVNVLEDEAAKFLDVVANDTDPDGGPIMIMTFTQPAHGTLTATGAGVTYTVAANYNGPDSFTYTLNGGSVGTVNLTVQAVNDVPSFTKGADQTVLEDAGAQTVAAWATMLGKGPANESAQVLDFLVTNDNNALFSTQPAISATGQLTYTPATNANGMATVTVRIHDDGGTANGGVDTSAAQTFTITVTAVNDAPSFTKGADQTVLEDATAQTVANWATAISPGPSNESAQTVTFTVTNNNNPLFSAQPAISPTGTLTYTVAANASGSATVSVTLKDNGGTASGGVDTSATQTFTITVTSVNDAPSFTKGADQTVLEDAAAQTVTNWATAISPGPASESAQTVSFTVTNNNNPLFSSQPSVSATGTLTYTLAANANGTATVSVTAKDSGGIANGGVDSSAAQTFTITVTAVNDAPSFTKGADQNVAEDASAQTVSGWATAINPGAANESGQTLSFTVSAIPSTLFSVQPAVAANGTLTYTLAANASGSASVTVTLKDNGGVANGGADTSASQTFTITVSSVNDAPSFTKGADDTVLEDSGARSVTNWATNLSAGPANESGQTLTFLVSATNSTLFSVQPAISSAGTLTYTPAANASGTSTVTVSLQDNGGTANGGVDTSASQTFTITVTSVNDAPSFTKGADQSVNEDAGAQSVAWATAISAGPADESGQTLTFTVTNNANSLFSVQPTIAANGTLTYTPAANANGSATVSVTLKDNGGTLNGGSDSSATVTFVIAIRTVNDTPTANADTLGPINEDSGAFTILPAQLTGNDSPGPTDEAGQTLTVTAVTAGTGGTVSLANGMIAFTPASNFFGTATFTYTVTDNGTSNGVSDPKSTTGSVSITVNPIDDKPVAAAISASIAEDVSTQVTLSYTDVENDQATACSIGSLSNLNLTVGCACTSGVCRVSVQGATNFNGAASFTYTVTANGAVSNSATASITVTPVNDKPTAVAESWQLSEDAQTTLFAVEADDIELANLTFSVATSPSHGTLGAFQTVDCNQPVPQRCLVLIPYTPDPDYNGTDSWTFRASDGSLSDVGTVSITILPVNDTPRAVGDSSTTLPGVKVDIDALANDTGLGDAPITVAVVSAPQGHTFTIDTNNHILYTPPAGFIGNVPYTYMIKDADGETSQARSSVSVNTPPTAKDDFGQTTTGKVIHFFPLTNDVDPEQDPITIIGFSQPSHGTVTQIPGSPGQLDYQPAPGYCDQTNGDKFEYQINGGSKATVFVTFIQCQ